MTKVEEKLLKIGLAKFHFWCKEILCFIVYIFLVYVSMLLETLANNWYNSQSTPNGRRIVVQSDKTLNELNKFSSLFLNSKVWS